MKPRAIGQLECAVAEGAALRLHCSHPDWRARWTPQPRASFVICVVRVLLERVPRGLWSERLCGTCKGHALEVHHGCGVSAEGGAYVLQPARCARFLHASRRILELAVDAGAALDRVEHVWRCHWQLALDVSEPLPLCTWDKMQGVKGPQRTMTSGNVHGGLLSRICAEVQSHDFMLHATYLWHTHLLQALL